MIADRFCTNFGPRLASTTPAVNSNFRSFLNNNNNPITLKASTIKELENISKTLASRKALGYDNIPMNVIKSSFHLISSPLANIINQSLQKGILPDKLKIAKVIPVYKKEDPFPFVNYKPISLLSNFSKFFERVMYNWLKVFVQEYDIHYCCQIGFRKNHSTSSLASIHLATNFHLQLIDMRPLQGFSKISIKHLIPLTMHQILFGKLEHYGVRGLALE